MQLVSGCPCSASTTPGTHAWRLDRLRATRHATERPMNAPCEQLLRALADTAPGEKVDDPEDYLGLLKAYGYADSEGAPVITTLGRRYLEAREELRWQCWVNVLSVDPKTRTAQVDVSGLRMGRPVTVLLDQLCEEAGLEAADLPGKRLEAEVNRDAKAEQDVVLTKVRAAEPQPEPRVEAAEGGVPGGQ